MTNFLTVDDYPVIRVSLGLAPDDEVTLPNATIELRGFLPEAERRMTAVLADCEVTFGDDEDDDEAIRQSVGLLAASIIGERYLARRGDQIKREEVGPVKVEYAAAVNYAATARQLRYDAGAAMETVCPDAVLVIAGSVFAVVDDWSDSEPGDGTSDI